MSGPLLCPSFPVSVFIAGDPADARRAAREFCMAGLCVTVTPTEYVYKGGSEAGVIVGLINYPRFPKEPTELERTALELAEFLMDRLFQVSATVQTPTHPMAVPPWRGRARISGGRMTARNIRRLVERGALFVVCHSGGKDSQAQFLEVSRVVPAAQLLVVHAHLEEVEWEGSLDHIRATVGDVPIIVAHPTKTFFDMVEHRGMFPSPSNRQCTSDLKRDPIDREIRRYLKAHPEFGGLVVNCMGMRAQESPGRAKLVPLKLNARNSKAGREWYDWLPIHDRTEVQVFDAIRAAGQEPFWTYAAGMRRKSCCFCIMACDRDLRRAAELKPALYRRYVETERRLGFTMSMSRRTLPEITGIAA